MIIIFWILDKPQHEEMLVVTHANSEVRGEPIDACMRILNNS